MPNETPLNHHQVKIMVNERTPNVIAFDFVENFLEEKIKWSRRCESIRTAKKSVGNWSKECIKLSAASQKTMLT